MFCRVNIEICFSSDIAGLSICIFLEEFHFLLAMSETNFIRLKFSDFFLCLWWVLFKYFWILYTNNEMAGLSCVGHTLVFVVLCRSYMGAILVFFFFFWCLRRKKAVDDFWRMEATVAVGMINTVFQPEHKEIACKWNGCYKLYSDVIFIDQ